MFITFGLDGVRTAPVAFSGVRRTQPAPASHRESTDDSSTGESELQTRAHLAYGEAQHPRKPPEPALLASQILNAPVITIVKSDSLSSAVRLLREKGMGHLPVIDSQGRLAGMLSDSDLQALRLSGIESEGNTDLVERHMATPVLAATPETDIRQIARIMLERKVGCMPIVNEAGAVVGIITRTDLLLALIQHPALELYA
jgi:acetoin utilization protein AcuB